MYETAYKKFLSKVPETGDTGEVFHRMKHASVYFQKVLKSHGVQNADHYLPTSIDTANNDGYTLFAVVYRPRGTIQVIDKYAPTIEREFHKSDGMYYEPFMQDIRGNNLDTIIDWTGIPRDTVPTLCSSALTNIPASSCSRK